MPHQIINKPEVIPFFHAESSTFSYLVIDGATDRCAIYDPVLDFDYASARTDTTSADAIIRVIQCRNLVLDWIIETHIHADHLSAAPYIQQKIGGKVGVSQKISLIQQTFGKIFNQGTAFEIQDSDFDYLFEEGERYSVGDITATVIATPGHTPACMTHVVGDAAFVGDTLFMPDLGTARCDFPGGDAAVLYRSIQKIFLLPADTRLFICHDYPPEHRAPSYQTTVAEQRAKNIHCAADISAAEFINMRQARDATLSMPKLIIPALQVNMAAGKLPQNTNGQPMLSIPVNQF